MCIKDADCFLNRGHYTNRKLEPVSVNLVTAAGDEWRSMRRRITPQFSSGKIKAMFPIFLEVSDNLNGLLYEKCQEDPAWDTRNLLQRFTSDVIGRCGFGLDCNALKYPESEFVQFGNTVLSSVSGMADLLGMIKVEFPRLCRLLGMRRYTEGVGEFYTSVVKQTIAHREENNVAMDDIMDALIKLMKSEGSNRMSLDEVVAQCMIFFVVGFVTTANSLTYIFYTLATHQDMQERVRKEVVSVLEKHANQVTYEAIAEMPLVEKFILGGWFNCHIIGQL